jgi:hypothetical protein
MQENIGRLDRIVRSVVGPALAGLGYMHLRRGYMQSRLANRRRGNLVLGALGVALGAIITETAVTRVCPFNALFGLDTRSEEERLRDSSIAFRIETRQVAEQYAALGEIDASRLA